MLEWSARGDYRKFQSARLREGWRRVRDPEREPDLGEPIEPVFETALPTAGLDRLRATFANVDDRAISPAHAWREPRQKPARYVSVSE